MRKYDCTVHKSLFERASITKVFGLGYWFDQGEKELRDEFVKISFPNEIFHLGLNSVYMQFFAGAAKAKMSNNLIERKLKVTATTRNYNTIVKMIQMLD